MAKITKEKDFRDFKTVRVIQAELSCIVRCYNYDVKKKYNRKMTSGRTAVKLNNKTNQEHNI